MFMKKTERKVEMSALLQLAFINTKTPLIVYNNDIIIKSVTQYKFSQSQTFAKINTRPCAAVRTCFCTEILCAPPPRGEIFTHIAK